MVGKCPVCKEVWCCIDKFGKSIYPCKICGIEKICHKDRDETVKLIKCPICKMNENQLEFNFPD